MTAEQRQILNYLMNGWRAIDGKLYRVGNDPMEVSAAAVSALQDDGWIHANAAGEYVPTLKAIGAGEVG